MFAVFGVEKGRLVEPETVMACRGGSVSGGGDELL